MSSSATDEDSPEDYSVEDIREVYEGIISHTPEFLTPMMFTIVILSVLTVFLFRGPGSSTEFLYAQYELYPAIRFGGFIAGIYLISTWVVGILSYISDEVNSINEETEE